MHNEAPYPINSTVRVIKYRGDGKVGKQAITYYVSSVRLQRPLLV